MMPPSLALYPLRATYGAKNNSHDLLSFNGDLGELPPALAGLTDRPPGHVAPNERWWPSVGCGPLGQWWVLWWTVPDEKAVRGGMVRSEVALWPIDLVAQIENLADVMLQLNGGGDIEKPAPALVAATVIALLEHASSPPVVTDLNAWPGLLAALWDRLWPQARRGFAARVAIVPPQNGESSSQPWLYALAQGQENKWPPSSIITFQENPISLSRAVRWMLGQSDSITDELIAECPLQGQFPTDINRIGRAADGLAALRLHAESSIAITTLRALAALAPMPAVAAKQKWEALTSLKNTFATSSAQVVLSLRNFKVAAYPPASMPVEEVKNWVAKTLPTLAAPISFLDSFAKGAEEEWECWWYDAVRAGLENAWDSKQTIWYKLLFLWLGASEKPALVKDLIVSAAHNEALVLEAAQQTSNISFDCLRSNCQTMAWSRLHAWALLQTLSAKEAFLAQLQFRTNAELGLVFLVDHLPSKDLIAAVIAIGNIQLLELSARRTSSDITLLVQLDLNLAAWRNLWSFHIAAGGQAWPVGIDRAAEAEKFLAAAFHGEYPRGVISILAADFAAAVLVFPERAKIWRKLTTDDSRALLQATAQALLDGCMRGDIVETPEPVLRDAVFAISDEISLSASIVTMLVGWDREFQEERARRWVARMHDWRDDSQRLGSIISERGWQRVASDLFSRSYSDESVLSTLVYCKNLLSVFDRWLFNWRIGGEQTTHDRNQIIAAVAKIGAECEASRLDFLWERAGGKPAQLETTGTPDEKWFFAAKKADSGALKGGLFALVKVLNEELPHNKNIQHLFAMLNKK